MIICDADHRYWNTEGGTDRELLSVSAALKVLQDETVASFYTPESAQRGTDVADALLTHFEGGIPHISETVRPYWTQILRFLNDGGFEVERAEEIIADLALGYAGRFDMVGWLAQFTKVDYERDLIDLKTGTVPSTVKEQTIGYRRRLPSSIHTVRRWALHVTKTSYRLVPLNMTANGRVDRMVDRLDEHNFLSALSVAKRRRKLDVIAAE